MSQPTAAQIRTLQLMVAALLVGAGTFLVIATYLVMTGDERGELGGFETILFAAWVAITFGSLLAWALVRRRQVALAAEAMSDSGADRPLAAFQSYVTITIVGAALAEASTLLAAAGGFATGYPGLLAGGLLGLVGIVLLFPSQAKFERFLEGADPSDFRPR